jgi:MscS family membrane protein
MSLFAAGRRTFVIGLTAFLVFASPAWAGRDGPSREVRAAAAQTQEGNLASEEAESGSPTVLQRLHDRIEKGMPKVLKQRAFFMENWKWAGVLLLIFVACIVDRLFRAVAGRVARRAANSQRIHLDSDVLLSFERPMGLLGAVLAFELLVPALGLSEPVLRIFLLATSFVATVAGVWAAYSLVDVICDYLAEKASRTANRFDNMLVPLARRTFKLFVLVVGIVFVASRLSDDLWGIVAGLGLGSIAVGFAARDSMENLFGTFTVLLDKPFQIGDWILVGDMEGTVEVVGFRSTRIRTFYNSLITVPNRTFISSNVDNMGERHYRRIKTLLSLTYDTPPEKIEALCEGVRQLIRSHPYTRKDYYHVYLNGLGASSLDVLLYCFLQAPDWGTELREKHRLFADILRLAERLEVSFAFPTQTLHVAKPEDLVHENPPESDSAGAHKGRKIADEIVEKTLKPFGGVGEKPPPVTIQPGPIGGDGGEG